MTEQKHILIAEDEKPMATALKTKLEGEGFVVTVVNNGEEAIAALQEQKIDLILLDLIMPKVDGWELLEHLKAQGNTIPIIVSTNLSQTEDEKRARELGVSNFLIKSNVPIADIVERIRQLL